MEKDLDDAVVYLQTKFDGMADSDGFVCLNKLLDSVHNCTTLNILLKPGDHAMLLKRISEGFDANTNLFTTFINWDIFLRILKPTRLLAPVTKINSSSEFSLEKANYSVEDYKKMLLQQNISYGINLPQNRILSNRLEVPRRQKSQFVEEFFDSPISKYSASTAHVSSIQLNNSMDIEVNLSAMMDEVNLKRIDERKNFATWEEATRPLLDITDSLSDEEEEEKEEEKEDNTQNIIAQLVENRLAPLSEIELQNITTLLSSSGNQQLIVIKKYEADITRHKLGCLRLGTWLNDEVINFYMKMLEDRDKFISARNAAQGRKSSHFFNSFFIDKLFDSGRGYLYSNVKRWTRLFNVFEKDKIFCPVNLSNTHWTLAVIFIQKKEIRYYDSMHGSGRDKLTGILKWLVDDAVDKKRPPVVPGDWTLKSVAEAPTQHNGCDCGVFTIMCADFLSDDLPVNEETYSQAHMPLFRKKIGAAIARGSLDYLELP